LLEDVFNNLNGLTSKQIRQFCGLWYLLCFCEWFFATLQCQKRFTLLWHNV